MAKCTWEGCTQQALHPCIARDGEKWADLCDEHKAKFDAAATAEKPGAILSAWVKAQGGSKAANARMTRSPSTRAKNQSER